MAAVVSKGISHNHFNGKIETPTIFEDSKMLAEWDFSSNMSSMKIQGLGPLGGDGLLYGAPSRAMTGSKWEAVEMNWAHAPEQWKQLCGVFSEKEK